MIKDFWTLDEMEKDYDEAIREEFVVLDSDEYIALRERIVIEQLK